MRNGSTLEGRMLWRPSGPDFTTGPDWPSSLLVGPGKRVLNGFVHIASTVTLFSYRPPSCFPCVCFVLVPSQPLGRGCKNLDSGRTTEEKRKTRWNLPNQQNFHPPINRGNTMMCFCSWYCNIVGFYAWKVFVRMGIWRFQNKCEQNMDLFKSNCYIDLYWTCLIYIDWYCLYGSMLAHMDSYRSYEWAPWARNLRTRTHGPRIMDPEPGPGL